MTMLRTLFLRDEKMGSEMSVGRAENLEFVPIVPTEIFIT
jgi:hypothetical protein